MENRPILIIAAMEDAELGIIKERFDNSKRIENNICTFIEGEMYGCKVVLCASDIGTINAAASLTLAIEKYKPKVIINEGLAGGIGDSVHTGDIVIGIDVINIASYETEKRKLGEGVSEYNELVSFIIGEDNKLIPQMADKRLIEIAKEISKNYGNQTIRFGRTPANSAPR